SAIGRPSSPCRPPKSCRRDGIFTERRLDPNQHFGSSQEIVLPRTALTFSLHKIISLLSIIRGRMSVHPAILAKSRRHAPPIFIGGHAASLSGQIVAQVRDALLARKLKPGDFLGTEKDLAARFGVSRIVARDALRTLQALGIADIKMGKGGGARVARGNPRRFAEALAVQLDLTGVSVAEIMDAQRAIETLAAELAAEHATAADHDKLRRLLDEAAAIIDDTPAYTRSCRDFHLAVAEASHNRVLVTQLI